MSLVDQRWEVALCRPLDCGAVAPRRPPLTPLEKWHRSLHRLAFAAMVYLYLLSAMLFITIAGYVAILIEAWVMG